MGESVLRRPTQAIRPPTHPQHAPGREGRIVARAPPPGEARARPVFGQRGPFNARDSLRLPPSAAPRALHLLYLEHQSHDGRPRLLEAGRLDAARLQGRVAGEQVERKPAAGHDGDGGGFRRSERREGSCSALAVERERERERACACARGAFAGVSALEVEAPRKMKAMARPPSHSLSLSPLLCSPLTLNLRSHASTPCVRGPSTRSSTMRALVGPSTSTSPRVGGDSRPAPPPRAPAPMRRRAATTAAAASTEVRVDGGRAWGGAARTKSESNPCGSAGLFAGLAGWWRGRETAGGAPRERERATTPARLVGPPPTPRTSPLPPTLMLTLSLLHHTQDGEVSIRRAPPQGQASQP